MAWLFSFAPTLPLARAQEIAKSVSGFPAPFVFTCVEENLAVVCRDSPVEKISQEIAEAREPRDMFARLSGVIALRFASKAEVESAQFDL
ncbi:MAG: hypothetical protein U0792_15675 [Gemmataceae bacterium]